MFTGCWDHRELKELAVVGATSMDLEGEEIKLTFQITKPKYLGAESASGWPSNFIQSTGKTIHEARNNASTKFDNYLFLPHVKEYIFSEEAAKKRHFRYD